MLHNDVHLAWPYAGLLAAGSLAAALVYLRTALRMLLTWWRDGRREGRSLLATWRALRGTRDLPPLHERFDVIQAEQAAQGVILTEHTTQLADLQRLASELVPNGGGSWRDEYRRDRDHQDKVNRALAAAVGATIPKQRNRRAR